MATQDITPQTTSPEEVTELITRNHARMGKIIKDAGITLN